jgi:two-component system OmpR family sensor kinase
MRAWHQTPLWLRLVTAMLVLAALAIALAGFFGAQFLRGYLTDRVDEQLRDVVAALQARGPITLDQIETPGPEDVPTPYYARVEDEDNRQVVVTRTLGDVPDLPSISPAQAEERDLDPFTVSATDGHGSFRAVAVPVTIQGGNGGRPGTLTVAINLDEVNSTVRRLVRIDLLVGAAVLAGLGLAGYTMVRTSLRPLTGIQRTADAIAGGDLSKRVEDDNPRTEVGRLGQALNAMLEQIETAFRARATSESAARRSEEKMRQFVADASHELRTPLTSIRGFAELHRQGAVTDPAELSRLLSRIESEAARMGLLVDDLLLLARLDEQRPFESAPVDLVVVAADAVESASAAAPGRDIRLDADGSVDSIVVGDEPRLRQVLSNLLDNALAYSPADTPVTVAVGRTRRDDHDVALMEVRDRGPGLTTEQAERVFERFYRTDKARSRAQGGTGLGLSIVAAITAAHGGSVEVDTEPGVGATFRVLLPLAAGARDRVDLPG